MLSSQPLRRSDTYTKKNPGRVEVPVLSPYLQAGLGRIIFSFVFICSDSLSCYLIPVVLHCLPYSI
jgi:hypothetical protein